MLRFYLSTLIGTGVVGRKKHDPIRPKVAEGFGEWGSIRLTDTVSLVGLDSASIITGSGIQLITDDPVLPSKSVIRALNQALSVDIQVESDKFLDWLVEFLPVMDKFAGFRPGLKPCRDGKLRIFLGNRQVYGEPLPASQSGTIHDSFDRANSDTLGTSSEGWSWVEQAGDIDIVSNKAQTGAAADSYAYANTGDPTSTSQYCQAKYTCGNNDGGGVTICHSTSAQTFYAGGADSYSNQWYIAEVTGGSWSLLATGNSGYADPSDTLYYLKRDGSALTFQVAGVTKVTASDSTITTVHAGIAGWDANTSKWDDFEAGNLSTLKTVTDSLALTDAVSAIKVSLALTDTLALSDAVSVYTGLVSKTITDSLSLTDAAPNIKALFALTDVLSLADALPSGTPKAYLSLTDSLSLADALPSGTPKAFIPVSDNLNLTDAISAIKVLLSLADTLSLTEAIIVYTGAITKTVTDNLSLTDATPGIKAFLTVADALSLAESLSLKASLTVNDTLALAEAISLIGKVSITDALALVDQIPAILAKLSLGDTLSINEALTLKVYTSILDSLDLLDTVNVYTGLVSRTITDDLYISEANMGEDGFVTVKLTPAEYKRLAKRGFNV